MPMDTAPPSPLRPQETHPLRPHRQAKDPGQLRPLLPQLRRLHPLPPPPRHRQSRRYAEARFFAALFLAPIFLAAAFFPAAFFGGGGTFASARLASESPIAIACFGLVTFSPLPLLSLPSFIASISRATLLLAAGEYFRPLDFFAAAFLPAIFFAVAMRLYLTK